MTISLCVVATNKEARSGMDYDCISCYIYYFCQTWGLASKFVRVSVFDHRVNLYRVSYLYTGMSVHYFLKKVNLAGQLLLSH